MTAQDLIKHGCAHVVAEGAIAALQKQAEGQPLDQVEENFITMATPAINAYRRKLES